MNSLKMPEDINHLRRRFLSTAAMAITAAQFGVLSSAKAEAPSETATENPHGKAGDKHVIQLNEADRRRSA